MENATSEWKGKEEKFTLIDSLITAMFIPKEYDKLLELRVGKVIRYIMVVVLLVCLIQYAIPGLGSIAGLGGLEGIIMNEIPQFSLEDGKFYFENKIDQTDEVTGTYFLVDTTVASFDLEDVPKNMVQALLISESNMILYNAMYGLEATTDTYSFEMFKDIALSNESLAEESFILYVGLGCFFLMLYVAAIVEYLFKALFYAIFLYFMVKIIVQTVTFDTLFKVAVFAQTIGVIVEAVTYSIGGELLFMVGSFFNVFVTVTLINKVVLRYKINDMQ